MVSRATTISADAPSFGVWLRWRRTERRLSAHQLALRAGLDGTYVSHLEMGRHRPTWPTAAKLAVVLELPAEEVAARAEAMNPEVARAIFARPVLMTRVVLALAAMPEPKVWRLMGFGPSPKGS